MNVINGGIPLLRHMFYKVLEAIDELNNTYISLSKTFIEAWEFLLDGGPPMVTVFWKSANQNKMKSPDGMNLTWNIYGVIIMLYLTEDIARFLTRDITLAISYLW